MFGFCITHILNTRCAKILRKKKKSVAKRLIWDARVVQAYNFVTRARHEMKPCKHILYMNSWWSDDFTCFWSKFHLLLTTRSRITANNDPGILYELVRMYVCMYVYINSCQWRMSQMHVSRAGCVHVRKWDFLFLVLSVPIHSDYTEELRYTNWDRSKQMFNTCGIISDTVRGRGHSSCHPSFVECYQCSFNLQQTIAQDKDNSAQHVSKHNVACISDQSWPVQVSAAFIEFRLSKQNCTKSTAATDCTKTVEFE